jgi:hypothetical protein
VTVAFVLIDDIFYNLNCGANIDREIPEIKDMGGYEKKIE